MWNEVITWRVPVCWLGWLITSASSLHVSVEHSCTTWTVNFFSSAQSWIGCLLKLWFLQHSAFPNIFTHLFRGAECIHSTYLQKFLCAKTVMCNLLPFRENTFSVKIDSVKRRNNACWDVSKFIQFIEDAWKVFLIWTGFEFVTFAMVVRLLNETKQQLKALTLWACRSVVG